MGTVRAVVRRIPFTLGVVAAMLVLGVATRSLWEPFEDSALFDDLAYGATAFAAGRWWTPVTGSFFALEPWEYVPVAGLFLLLVGWTEHRLGTRRAAIVTVVAQLAAIVGSAAALTLLARAGSGWAARVGAELDAGFSGGVLGAVTVTALSLPRPWRFRASALVAVYVLAALLAWGGIADVEHVVGWIVGLAVARPLLGPRLGPRTQVGRVQRARVRASGYFAISALLVVLTSFASALGGPIGVLEDGGSWPSGLIGVTIDLVLALGLLRGRRSWWRVALVLTIISVVLELLLVVAEIVLVAGDLRVTLLMLLLDGGALVLLVARRDAFRNRRHARPAADGTVDQDTARATLARLGAGQRLAWMTTWAGNERWSPEDVDGYVAHQVHAGVAVALTDPVGDGPQGRAELVDAFVDAASAAGLGSCFFSAGPELAGLAAERGWTVVTVAEEAVIDLPGLEFKGKKWQDVRTALNQAAKQGIEHRLVTLADEPEDVVAQVHAISEAWLGDSDLPEMAFTLGGVREALDPAVRVGLAVDAEGRVHGVTSWLPVHAPGGEVVGWTLDVMRRAPESFRATMELLIGAALMTFRDEGAREASLSGSPLAHGTPGPDTSPGRIDTALDRLAGALEPLYGFDSLHRFKKKFQPRDVPLVLAVPDPATLTLVGLALVRCYLPDARARDLVAAARSSREPAGQASRA